MENKTVEWDNFPVVMTVEQARAVLGIGRGSMYQLARSKKFPVLLIGKSIRIPREPFREFVETGSVS